MPSQWLLLDPRVQFMSTGVFLAIDTRENGWEERKHLNVVWCQDDNDDGNDMMMMMSGGEGGVRGDPDVTLPSAWGQEALRGHPQGQECPKNGHHRIFR